MEERLDISLREAEGVNPKGLLKRIVRELQEKCFNVDDLEKEFTTRVDKESSLRASEIMNRALEIIAKIAPDETQDLLRQRQEIEEAICNSTGSLRSVREEAFEAAIRQRCEAVQCVLAKLRDLGVNITAEAVKWQVSTKDRDEGAVSESASEPSPGIPTGSSVFDMPAPKNVSETSLGIPTGSTIMDLPPTKPEAEAADDEIAAALLLSSLPDSPPEGSPGVK